MTQTHCPACGAAVRPESLWCQLCHLDLRPPPEPPVVVVEPSAPEPESVPAEGADALLGRHARAAGWPCAACGGNNDLGSTSCTTCGSGFLATLQSDSQPALRLPVLGDLSKLGRPAMFGLALGVGLLGALLLAVVMALAGAVL